MESNSVIIIGFFSLCRQRKYMVVCTCFLYDCLDQTWFFCFGACCSGGLNYFEDIGTFSLACFSPHNLSILCLFLQWLGKHRQVHTHSWVLCSSLHTPCREPQGIRVQEEEELRVVGSELEQGFSAGLARLSFAASTVTSWDWAWWPWSCQRLEGGGKLLLSEGRCCFSNLGCSSHPKDSPHGSSSSNPGFRGLDRRLSLEIQESVFIWKAPKTQGRICRK